MKRIPTASLVQFSVLTLVLGLLIYVSLAYGPLITRLATQPEQLREFLLAYGARSVLVFMLLQALQVIIAAIPGEFTQLAGGYIYGAGWGTLYSSAGILLGSGVAFFITHCFGYPILKIMISPSKIERFAFFINSPRTEVITFVLFLLPGMPKDILTYLAGLTPIRPVSFFIIASLARFPGILISSYIGAGLEQNQYGRVACAAAVAVLFLVLGWLFKDKLIELFKNHDQP